MAYTDVELILDQLEDIKDISSAELSLIEQLSVKMLPDKVVNQSSRLKGAMANPVTASNGISKYINLRITAINQAISEIKSKWNEVIPLSTSDITTLKTRLDTLTMGVSEEYNSLYKIEQIVKAIKGNPTSDYNSLEKLENKLKQEITDRDNAIKTSIDSLIDDSPQALDTLRELSKALGDDPNFSTTILNKIAQTLTDSKAYTDEKISQEVQDRNSAITSNVTSAVSTAKEELIGGATSSYNTMGKLETAIKQIIGSTEGSPTTIEGAILKANEYTDSAIEKLVGTSSENLDTLQELAQALGNDPNFATTVLNKISAIKGTPTSDYDSLEKIENKLKEEVKAREQAIEEIYDEVPQTIHCNHEYEITGNTGDEHGLAVKDQQMLLKRIEGQTGRYSENELNIQDKSYIDTYEKCIISNGVISMTHTKGGTNTKKFKIPLLNPLKAGVTYTITNFGVDYRNLNYGQYYLGNDTNHNATGSLPNNGAIRVYTPQEDLDTLNINVSSNAEDFTDVKLYIMIVKGTYTEDTIPAFKPYDNTLVNAKCNFISTGRQLWDEEWEQGSISTISGNIIEDSTQFRSKNFIPYIPKSNYNIKFLGSKYGAIIFFYDSNKNYITYQDIFSNKIILNDIVNAKYIKFRTYTSYGNVYNNDILISCIENGDYEPYIENSITYNRELTAYGYHDNETNITYEYGSEIKNYTTGNTLPSEISNGYIANRDLTETELSTLIAESDIQLVYKQSTPRYTIEEYLPNGYDVYNGGMQIQSIDGKYLPYNLTKVYSVSIADQLNANREIDKGQQEQIDEVKNKTSVLEQEKLNARTYKGYDNTEIINDGKSIVIKKFVDDTSTTNRITVDSNKIEIYNHANDEGITKKIVMDDGGITLSIDDNGETSTFNINKNLATITSPSINLNGVDINNRGHVNILTSATLNGYLEVTSGDVEVTDGIFAGTLEVQNFDSDYTNISPTLYEHNIEIDGYENQYTSSDFYAYFKIISSSNEYINNEEALINIIKERNIISATGCSDYDKSIAINAIQYNSKWNGYDIILNSSDTLPDGVLEYLDLEIYVIDDYITPLK